MGYPPQTLIGIYEREEKKNLVSSIWYEKENHGTTVQHRYWLHVGFKIGGQAPAYNTRSCKQLLPVTSRELTHTERQLTTASQAVEGGI